MGDLVDKRAFPELDEAELILLRENGYCQTLADGEVAIAAGDADVDFVVVESGLLDVVNPVDNNRVIATHGPRQFMGDIDLLTQRPVLISVVAHGHTEVLRVPGEKLRHLLGTVPKLSEKLLVAFQVRRQMLSDTGKVGLQVLGPGQCRGTTEVREFLYKNFVPFTWYDTQSEEGKAKLDALGAGARTPTVRLNNGNVLQRPTLRDVAIGAGVWQACPTKEYDLVVVGGGPAGMSAAVYAASEGIKTLVLDKLGPGGQAGGSSRIENFIGFPAGLSGTDLATRAVLQMFKFGAKLAAPIAVNRLEPGKGNEPHILHTDCGAAVRANVVLVSTGVRWRKLDVPGADKFERAGVFYACTTVEARGYEGKPIVVIGGGNSAGQAAMFLAENCAEHVHLLVRRGELAETMSEYLSGRLATAPNVTIRYHTEVAAVRGERFIEGVDLKSRNGGADSSLDCAAIFVFIGSDPHTGFLPADVARDEQGYLLTGPDLLQAGCWPLKDRAPCPLETSVPRVLAGGDVRTGTTKRVGFAVGDGSLAVTCVHRLRSM